MEEKLQERANEVGEIPPLKWETIAEALRRGLAGAEKVYVVADGGVWIWNIVKDRFTQAHGVLDYYHASEHLWVLGRELYAEDSEAAAWVRGHLKNLQQGKEGRVLESLESLLRQSEKWEDQKADVIEREVNYFSTHQEHLKYKQVEEEGCPKGSGAMESTCAQFQTRFKLTGQFWTKAGEGHLMALELARRNGDWREIWAEQLVALCRCARRWEYLRIRLKKGILTAL